MPLKRVDCLSWCRQVQPLAHARFCGLAIGQTDLASLHAPSGTVKSLPAADHVVNDSRQSRADRCGTWHAQAAASCGASSSCWRTGRAADVRPDGRHVRRRQARGKASPTICSSTHLPRSTASPAWPSATFKRCLPRSTLRRGVGRQLRFLRSSPPCHVRRNAEPGVDSRKSS